MIMDLAEGLITLLLLITTKERTVMIKMLLIRGDTLLREKNLYPHLQIIANALHHVRNKGAETKNIEEEFLRKSLLKDIAKDPGIFEAEIFQRKMNEIVVLIKIDIHEMTPEGIELFPWRKMFKN